MNDPYCSLKECAGSLAAECDTYKRLYDAEVEKNRRLMDKLHQMGPCSRCMFNPPSSCDGKPCSICPATKKIEENEDD